jgi:hypothetical protein
VCPAFIVWCVFIAMSSLPPHRNLRRSGEDEALMRALLGCACVYFRRCGWVFFAGSRDHNLLISLEDGA